MTHRSVTKVFTAAPSHDGDGVALRRAFPGPELMDLDPFLLLDHLGPTPLAPGEARGFPSQTPDLSVVAARPHRLRPIRCAICPVLPIGLPERGRRPGRAAPADRAIGR